MIEAHQLTKRFGNRVAVDAASFSVSKGEIVGFLGPNGAGKSTTLRMLTGYMAPTEGSVRIAGIDVLADPNRARATFGYMPEGVPMYPEMRVVEYLRYRAELKGIGRGKRKAAVSRALEQASVADAERRIIGQLSKGYKQRVGLADALLSDPALLILDEPTSGLDPNQIKQVRELIRQFRGDKTVFLSTHILPEVEATCDRVVIINEGRIVGEGTPEELRRGSQGVIALVRGTRAEVARALDEAGLKAQLSDEGDLIQVNLASQKSGSSEAGDRAQSSSSDAAERLASALVSAGLGLRSLRANTGSLEDVFTSLTLSTAAETEPESESETESESESESETESETDSNGEEEDS